MKIRTIYLATFTVIVASCSTNNSKTDNNSSNAEKTEQVEQKTLTRPEKTEELLFKEIEVIYGDAVSLYSSFNETKKLTPTIEKNLSERINSLKAKLEAINPKTDNLSEDDYSKFTWSTKQLSEFEVKLESLKQDSE